MWWCSNFFPTTTKGNFLNIYFLIIFFDFFWLFTNFFFVQEGEEVSDAVKVKGPGNCVDQAIAMIKEHTDDFIAQVTEEIEIEKHFHGDIIGKGGKQVQEVKNIRWYILYGWFERKIWSRGWTNGL